MSARNIEDIYPLSPMQQGMLFHSIYAPESGMYVEQMSCTLRGSLSVDAFERAWRRVISRHTPLRTAFVWQDLDEPLQVVQRQVSLPLEQHDWRALTSAQQAARLEAFQHEDRQRGLDLSEAPLMRLTLIRLADDRYQFVWTHHHLLIDGWSVPLLFQEVFQLYEAFRQGRVQGPGQDGGASGRWGRGVGDAPDASRCLAIGAPTRDRTSRPGGSRRAGSNGRKPGGAR